MKKYYLNLFICIVAGLCFSCQDSDDVLDMPFDDSNNTVEEFSVSDDAIVSPKWLASVVDSVAKSHLPGVQYVYPWVYSVSHDDVQYYMVWDMVTSTWGQYFYTLSGEMIPINEGLYDELLQEKNRTELWKQPLSK